MPNTSLVSKKEKSSNHLELFIDKIWDCVQGAVVEFWKGLKTNTLPWPRVCAVGALFAVLFTMRLDALLWKRLGIAKFYPFHPLFYWPYVAIFTGSGFLAWAFQRAWGRIQLTNELTEVFRSAGLETRTNRVPGFIKDESMDTHLRRLVLASRGVPEADFLKAKPQLETGLQIYIDQIKSRIERGTVELFYAYEPMTENVTFNPQERLDPLFFKVGMTRSKGLYSSLRETPHILAAGYTNSGKSTFVRQLLTTLMLNNPGIEFTLIDLKSGLELGIFLGIPNVRLYVTPTEAIEALKYVEIQLEKRMALLRANRCSDFDAFYRLQPDKRVYTSDWPEGKPFVRHAVAIDEAAELFMASATLASKDAQVAKRLAAKIAALGRAVGIHLIISTQRPDRNAVDPLIKSNLQGRLCFQMADNASSMTILDSVRAADLPPIKGRAIWRSGFDLIEVQVPWLDRDKMEELLAPLRTTKAQSGSETSSMSKASTSEMGAAEEIPLKDDITIQDENRAVADDSENEAE